MLDNVSSTRPIIVWQRSVRELYFNTRALQVPGYEESDWLGNGEASEMSNWAKGHVWEKGVFMVAPVLFTLVASPEKFRKGLERAHGVSFLDKVFSAGSGGCRPVSMVKCVSH